MILDELHITQRDAVAERHAHTVTGDDAAVGVVAVYAARAARCHHHRISADLDKRAFHHVHCHQSARMTVVDQNVENEMFVKALDLWELEGGLEQGVQHVEAGLIGGKPVRSIFMPPKRRTLTLPSGRRLHGHPHCSSWVISVGQWCTK